MNARIGLAAGALAVAGLVVLLVIKIRESPDDQASAAAPAAGARAPDQPSTTAPRPAVAGPVDASPLPTPDEVAEAKARVESEHVRDPFHAPQILDNNLKAQPMRQARKAMQKGEYDTALKAAEDALAVEPESNAARVLAVMAACSLGERAVAQAHADKLDDMRKSRVAQRCQKFGIEIKGAKPMDPDQ